MERIAEQLAAVVHSKPWCTWDWEELREFIQQQPVDTLLRMGEDELRNHVERSMFERLAIDSGAECALVGGLL